MTDAARESVARRTEALFAEEQRRIHVRTDRLFAGLLAAEWLAAIVGALWLAPLTWAGRSSQTHIHVWASLFLGGPIALFPISLALTRPGDAFTRHVVAVGQMLMSGLLIQISGGRLETHFHIFGSLAFLAFYRDWKIFIPATVVVALDHFARGIFWPLSVYGVPIASQWRSLEHAGWVLFTDVFLVDSCRSSVREMWRLAGQRAQLERTNQRIEHTVLERTAELRASEERVRSISAASPIGIFQTDADGGYTYVNARWEDISELGAEEARGDGWSRSVHPDDRPALLARWADAVRTGRETAHEFRLVTPSGEVKWVHARTKEVRGPDGGRLGYVGSLEDLTERKLAERRLAAQYAVTEHLATSTTLAEASPKILQALCEISEWDLGDIWIVDREANLLRCVDLWHDPAVDVSAFAAASRSATFAPGIGVPGRVWATGTPTWIPDVHEDGNFPRAPVAARDGIHCAFGIPLVAEREVLGVLELCSRRVRRPEPALLAMLASSGSQIGQFIERKRAEEAVRRSEEHFRALIEHGSDVITVLDAEGIMRYVSPAARSVLGYAVENLIGRRGFDYIHPDDVDAVRHVIARLLVDPTGVERTDYRYRHGDGSWRYMEAIAKNAARTGDGSGIVVTSREVTERKRAEALLSGQKQVLERLAQGGALEEVLTMLVSTIETQLPGMICAVLGFDEEARCLRCLAAPGLSEAYRTTIEGLPVDGEPIPSATAVVRQKLVLVEDVADDPRWPPSLEISARERIRAFATQPIASSEGQILGAFVMAWREPRRVTPDEIRLIERAAQLAGIAMERKRDEAAIAEARDRALEVAGLTSQFLANMSHEIRTPMNSIIGMTGLALERQMSPELRADLEMVRSSADSLLTLLNNVLDFSKIEAGRVELETIPFVLRDALGDSLAPLAIRAHEKGLELALDVTRDVPEVVVGDPARLGQVVVNLVGNAIKFTQRGEVVLRVRLEAADGDGALLRVSVLDTGVGIPADKHQLIFESFAQADGSTTRKYGGTGLGLAIASQLVGLMGGSIAVDSEPGRGSEFSFTIRLGVQDDEPRTGTRGVLHDARVLVADDNATSRRILGEMLTGWGLSPTLAADRDAALAALDRALRERKPFAVALLDADLLTPDWSETATKAGLPLVVLVPTGRVYPRVPGVARSVAKPVKASHLLEAIEATLAPAKGAEDALPAVTTSRVARGLRVLLAEDNEVNRHVARRLLEKHAHCVTEAEDGHAAVAAVERERFDVVLMDVQMPGMDGIEATRAIRRLEATSDARVPIVALTAHVMKGDRERCLEAGMDAYVRKPLDPDELFAVLEGLLDRRAPPPPPPAASRAHAVLDREAVLRRMEGDTDLLIEAVELFQAESRKALAEIRRGLTQRDPKAVARAAHRLRGTLGTLAAEAAADAAGTLEASSGQMDDAGTACAALEREIDRLQPELRALVESLASGVPA